MVTNYKFPEERPKDPAFYAEKESVCTEWGVPWTEYIPGKSEPPRLQEVIATDGRNVKEAWLNADGQWMRINEKWERASYTAGPVTHYMEKPAPPLKKR